MILIDLPREAVLQPGWWAVSPGVPRRERPPAPEVGEGGGLGPVEPGTWREALDALTNAGDASLGYDQWRDVIFAIHHETGGSDEGLALAHAWSSRSEKYDREFLDARVWPYVSVGGGITGRTVMSLASKLAGWQGPDLRLNPDDFGVVGDGYGQLGLRTGVPVDHPAGGSAGAAGRIRVAERNSGEPPERRGVPAAQHLCTDQANAERLVKAYGSRVLVAGGRWYVWDGRRWKADEGDVYRFACRLSDMVKEEAKGVVARALELGDLEKRQEAEKTAAALVKWSVRSEMKATIEAAVGLARKMLTVEVDWLDRDPWLLNCLNGVVDLRTGELREHRAADLMTRLIEVEYEEGAVCEEWERVVLEVCGGDVSLAGFLQRWFGYCLTGLTWEQVFCVHWGEGGNGKSLLLELMARTMGDYCGIAAPSLVAGKGDEGDRHPTEVAALLGRRMVTAHETGEGAVLREAFVKRATGDERMTARYMREDFFEFNPTHKLQLLTNAKPVIKGQDRGIWRRVLLVPYGVTWGSAEDVREGRAQHVKDVGLLARLSGGEALRGVLAWRVRGAVEWARDGGLRAPDVVRDASARYQAESDRVRQFVDECCVLQVSGEGGGGVAVPTSRDADPGSRVTDRWSEPLTLGMGGVYPAYVSWAKDAGFHPLSRNRFVDELVRTYKVLRVVQGYGPGESGNRRKITRIEGLRLVSE